MDLEKTLGVPPEPASPDPTRPDPTRVAPEICYTFGQLLQTLERGQLDHDLADMVRHCIAEVEARAGGDGKASLTLRLDFAIKDGIVDVQASAAAKTPQAPRGRTILWVTPENRLTRANPNQYGLPLRDVNAPGRTRSV